MPDSVSLTDFVAPRTRKMSEKHRCVILADAHRGMREGVRGLLETVFDAVVMVADEPSLFEAADRLDAQLAVVDLSLPVSAEANVMRRLRARHAGLRIVILSVHDEPSAVAQALASNVEGFVLKRSAATDLLPAVREVLGGGTYVSPGAGQSGDQDD